MCRAGERSICNPVEWRVGSGSCRRLGSGPEPSDLRGSSQLLVIRDHQPSTDADGNGQMDRTQSAQLPGHGRSILEVTVVQRHEVDQRQRTFCLGDVDFTLSVCLTQHFGP